MRFYPLGPPPGYDPKKTDWSGCIWFLLIIALIVLNSLACGTPISIPPIGELVVESQYRTRPYVMPAVPVVDYGLPDDMRKVAP